MHAARSARGPRIAFGLSTNARRLELTIGPFRPGTGSELREERPVRDVGSALVLLSDTVEIEPSNGDEMLRVVMTDAGREPLREPLP